MSTATLTVSQQLNQIARFATMKDASQVADSFAAQSSMNDYQDRKANNTTKNQLSDLRKFSEFLSTVVQDAPAAEILMSNPQSWGGVTFGLVKSFVLWRLKAGHAIASINRSLSTIKAYAKLAFVAGTITDEQHSLIRTVTGYGSTEQDRINAKREVTRTGNKKATATEISDDQAALLKSQTDTPQGRRDNVLMSLLLDHGLRVGEVAIIEVTNTDLKKGVMKFKRPKVSKAQKHKLSADTIKALRAYADCGDMPAMGKLLRGSNKAGVLTDDVMSDRAIQKRVEVLGEEIGLKLSPHDCRHYWATKWAGKVDLFRLQEAGGWNSLAMPRRYTKQAEIANEGMV